MCMLPLPVGVKGDLTATVSFPDRKPTGKSTDYRQDRNNSAAMLIGAAAHWNSVVSLPAFATGRLIDRHHRHGSIISQSDRKHQSPSR